jgi:hypothetical protein
MAPFFEKQSYPHTFEYRFYDADMVGSEIRLDLSKPIPQHIIDHSKELAERYKEGLRLSIELYFSESSDDKKCHPDNQDFLRNFSSIQSLKLGALSHQKLDPGSGFIEFIGLQHLNNLQELFMNNFDFRYVDTLKRCLSSLSQIQSIQFSSGTIEGRDNKKIDMDFLTPLKNLQVLSFEKILFQPRSLDLSKFSQLEELSCSSKAIRWDGEPSNLKKYTLSNEKINEPLPDMQTTMPNLEFFSITDASLKEQSYLESVIQLKELAELSLASFSMDDFKWVKDNTAVKKLTMHHIGRFNSLEGIAHFQHLEHFYLEGEIKKPSSFNLDSLNEFKQLKNLQKFTIYSYLSTKFQKSFVDTLDKIFPSNQFQRTVASHLIEYTKA